MCFHLHVLPLARPTTPAACASVVGCALVGNLCGCLAGWLVGGLVGLLAGWLLLFLFSFFVFGLVCVGFGWVWFGLVVVVVVFWLVVGVVPLGPPFLMIPCPDPQVDPRG